MTSIKLYEGNCLDVLRKCPDNYMDSIVCDPPYGLSFMNKGWDYQVPSTEIWKECLRVLKPGGHLLAFGGTRTYHRLVVNIEDAGFEIRDQIMWIYGSGFPKSQNVNKASGGEVAEGIGTALKPANEPICLARKPLSEKTVAKNVLKHGVGGLNVDAGRIETAEVKEATTVGGKFAMWNTEGDNKGFERHNGNGTSNPLGRFPANILFDEHAAGVLDGQTGDLGKSSGGGMKRSGTGNNVYSAASGHPQVKNVGHGDSGGASRFFQVIKQDEQCNANTVKLSSSQQKELDDFVQKLVAISERQDIKLKSILTAFTSEMRSELNKQDATSIETIQNIAARFLQELQLTNTSTSDLATNAEAQMLTGITKTTLSLLTLHSCAEAVTSNTTLSETAPGGLDLGSKFLYVAKASKKDRGEGNTHPTVKPIKLMEYLIKLVTPEGGIVLDPFMGSGTTGVAAQNLGFGFRGIEMTPEYFQIAKQRILGASEESA